MNELRACARALPIKRECDASIRGGAAVWHSRVGFAVLDGVSAILDDERTHQPIY